MRSHLALLPSCLDSRVLASIAAAALLSASGCESYATKDTKPTVNVNVQTASQFNHRGMVNVNNWVLIPDFGLRLSPIRILPEEAGGVVQVKTRGYLNLTEKNDHAWFNDGQGGKFSEIDFKAEYSRQVPITGDFVLDVGGGSLSYINPNASFFPNGARGSTTELFATVGTSLFPGELYGFYPHAEVHYDPDEVDGFYWAGGVGKTLGIGQALEAFGLKPAGDAGALLDRFSFTLNATVAYSSLNHSDWTYGLEEAGFSDFSGSGTLTFRIDKNTVISTGVGGAVIIDPQLRDWFDDIDIRSDNVWVTFGIGWEFGSSS